MPPGLIVPDASMLTVSPAVSAIPVSAPAALRPAQKPLRSVPRSKPRSSGYSRALKSSPGQGADPHRTGPGDGKPGGARRAGRGTARAHAQAHRGQAGKLVQLYYQDLVTVDVFQREQHKLKAETCLSRASRRQRSCQRSRASSRRRRPHARARSDSRARRLSCGEGLTAAATRRKISYRGKESVWLASTSIAARLRAR